MINEIGTLAHPHPSFSFLGGMTTKGDWGLPIATNTLEVRKESFRVMVLHQATSLCDRSIPHGDGKKVWELPQAWER